MNKQTKAAFEALRDYTKQVTKGGWYRINGDGTHTKTEDAIFTQHQARSIGRYLGKNQLFAAQIEITKLLRELGYNDAVGNETKALRTISMAHLTQAILEDLMGQVDSVYGCVYCGTEQSGESIGCCGESSAHFDDLFFCDSNFSPSLEDMPSDEAESIVSNWDTLLNECNKELSEGA